MRPTLLQTNGITLSTYVDGEGPTVVLAHGFPELGYSWRHQVTPLVKAGYRVVVPDMRGYGASDRPTDVAAYNIDELAADLIGLLDVLEQETAVFVGHDWGASVVWHVASAHPERVRGVVGLSVPYTPPAPVAPLSILRRRLGDDFYMVWFQQPGVADAELARDVRQTMVGTFAPGSAGLTWDVQNAEPPIWITSEELDVYVSTFERTGFSGGLNYYRNIDRNWEIARDLGTRLVSPPALFVTGSNDLVSRFTPSDGLASHFADLRGNVVLDGADHWVQQERPKEINALILDFLEGLPAGPRE